MISREEFERLKPFHRGYTVYLYGSSDDEPHVPAEDNPYEDIMQKAEWNRGKWKAMEESDEPQERT